MIRALAFALALLLAVPARADGPLEPPASDVPRDIKATEPAPADGVWMSRPRSAWLAAEHQTCVDGRKQCQIALESKPLQPEDSGTAVKVGLSMGIIGTAIGIALGVIAAAAYIKR